VTGHVRTDDGRTRHYGHFYGLSDLPDGDIAIVLGNCQAESIRIMLDGGGLSTVRIPPVHEIEHNDLPHLDRLLKRTALLVSQPIRDDYRGLPLGVRQVSARLPASSRTALVPVVRFAGLYPTHAIIRPPSDTSLTPPVVEYHDLATLTEAADRLHNRPTVHREVTIEMVRAIAELSLTELRKREIHHKTVTVSDLFASPSFDQMRTINHPGNTIWVHIAQRLRQHLGLPEHEVSLNRPLLNSVHAPRTEAVINTFGLSDQPTDFWRVNGIEISAAEVRETHLEWYAANPDVIDAGLTRHHTALGHLGLLS
jgi:hypothetical protein